MLSTSRLPSFRGSVLLVIALLVWGRTFPLYAQIERINDSWRWVHFGQESGLPSERVIRIAETDDGHVWAHTSRGLAWFDGFRWNSAALPIISSQEMETGDLFAGETDVVFWTYSGVFVGNQSGFRTLTSPAGHSFLGAMCRMSRDAYVTQIGTSLYQMRGNSYVPFSSPLDSIDLASKERSPTNFQLYNSGEGPWLKVQDRLFRWTGTGWDQIVQSPAGYLKIQMIAEDRAGNGVAILEDAPGILSVYEWSKHMRPRKNPQEQGDLATSISFVPSGDPVVLTSTGDLRIRRNGRWADFPRFPPPIVKPLQIKFRRNGDLWVATESGMFLCRLSSERWEAWKTRGNERENIVNEILPARDGTIWIGTRDGVAQRRPDGSMRWFKRINGENLGRVTGVAEDEGGNIWISSGASFSGAYRWNGKGWKHFGPSEGLLAPRVHRIVRDRQGRLWFLGIGKGVMTKDYASEPGAYVYEDGAFTRWGTPEGLPDGRVYCMAQDRRGALWFGTFTGLSRWRDGHWTIWREAEGLKADRVFTLTIDSTGKVAFGHNWFGMGTIDAQDSVHYITSADGLPNDKVWGLTTDDQNRVWVATENGLGCVVGEQILSFDMHSGLPNPVLWPVVASRGRIYVGTKGDGVAVLNQPSPTDPPPRITLEQPSILEKTVLCRWAVNAFWAEVQANQILTRYRIDEGPWSEWNTERRTRFLGLSYGQHTVSVQSKGQFGIVELEPATEHFEVPPPFYLRPLFYAPVGSLLALLAWLMVVSQGRKRKVASLLRESEERIHAQYRSNPIPTITLQHKDQGFLLVDCNDAARQLSHDQITSILGRPLDQVVSHVPEFLSMVKRCYKDKSVVRSKVRFPVHGAIEQLDLDVTCAFVAPDMVLVHGRDIRSELKAEVQIRESHEQLRALAGRLDSIREEERRRLSREIHDELGQAITGLKMDVAWIHKKLTQQSGTFSPSVIERLSQMNALLDETIKSVRRMASDLRPVVLDDLGLSAAIEWQAREFQERTGVKCYVTVPPTLPLLRREASTELFRILQEVLTNVARHAHAQTVSIRLEPRNTTLHMMCHDDGIGIALSALGPKTSLGILGMEERARRIGAVLKIESREGEGTVVSVDLPLHEDRSS